MDLNDAKFESQNDTKFDKFARIFTNSKMGFEKHLY